MVWFFGKIDALQSGIPLGTSEEVDGKQETPNIREFYVQKYVELLVMFN